MTRTLLIILVLLNLSCANKRARIENKRTYSEEILKGEKYTSPNGDYSIDFGKKWKLAFRDSPDSSDIVINTHVVDLNDVQMLRIYRNDDSKDDLDVLMEMQIQKIKEFRKNSKISEVSKESILQFPSLSIDCEYNDGGNYIERVFVMKANNGNYYVFEILATNNESQINRLNELIELLKTFESK